MTAASAKRRTYALFGRRVSTSLALPARTTEQAPDLIVDIAPAGEIGLDPPDGQLLADFGADGVRWYAIARQPTGAVIRLPGICELSIAADGRSARLFPSPGLAPEALAILLAGTGIALVLTLAGETVLHGSAASKDGAAMAFLGDSGQGKSTMTSLFCLADWDLLCDDVLRLDTTQQPHGQLTAHPGGTEIRLRPKARFDPTWPSRTTFDQRTAVAPPSVAEPTRVQALIIPTPNRSIERVRGIQLTEAEATGRLLELQRIGGWQDPDLLRASLASAALVGRSTPVWVVDVPWEDRLSVDVVDQVMALVTGS